MQRNKFAIHISVSGCVQDFGQFIVALFSVNKAFRNTIENYFHTAESSNNSGRPPIELTFFESAATPYICQMRSVPAMNQTRHLRSVTSAR